MSNRPQFTVLNLLLWTTVLAVGTASMKLVLDSEIFRSSSSVADFILLEPAWAIMPCGLFGIFVVPAGMLVMLASMTSEHSRTWSTGIFLAVTTICWVALIVDGDSPRDGYMFVVLVMTICSAACFIEAFYRSLTVNPDTLLRPKRFFATAFTSAIIVVATSLFWGSAVLLSLA